MEIQNKKVNFDYEIIDTYETGIVFTGTEIKSIRAGRANLKDSYAIIKNNEIPTIFIHSKADKKVDFNCVLELFNNSGSEKELFPIKENYLFELDGLNDDYSKTVNAYIKRHCQ